MSSELTRRMVLKLAGAAAITPAILSKSVLAQASSGSIDQVRWALPAVSDTLFIPHAWTTYIGAIMSLVQEGMLAFGDDLSLQPGVAESWKQVDPTTITYTLRSGVKFHDGSPLTPEDVVASMTYHMNPKSGSQLSAFYSAVSSVEATGDAEVTVKLKDPNVQYQYTPAHMAGFIFKASQLKDHPDDIGTPDVLPLGTGPYKLVEFAPGDHVVLEAFEDYWGTKPAAKRIIVQQISDRQTRLLAMRNGDVQGTFDLSISDIDQWKNADNIKVVTAPSLGVYNLTLDHSAPPFDDVHVRKAIAYSVDRAGLVKALLKGYGTPAVALDPPQIWAGVLPADEVRSFYDTLESYEFDLDKAKAELKKSKHPDGFEISVPASNADPYMVNILQTIAQNVSQIGIQMTVQEIDHNQWLTQFFAHENLGMQMMPYFPDYADPVNYPYLFYSSENAAKDGLNGSNFKNDEVDKLLAEANQKSDPSVRADALKKVFKIANEDVAMVHIFWPDTAMALNSDYHLNGFNAFWYNVPWAIRGFGKNA